MVQIAFVTLFLGLTLGSQPVELTVSGPVASVELRLDGNPVGRIEGPPWAGRIDFGARLEPHELVARALDQQGEEIGRTSQWLNLPRPPAEVEILLERGAGGKVAAARILWQSLTGVKPDKIGVTFDNRPLTADARGRAAIPSYDPEASHVLSAELRFPGAMIARKDVVFGGRYGEEVSTELTGIPVRLRKGKRLPPVDRLQGWFTAGGKPLAVGAVEDGPAQLLVVRDDSAREPLQSLQPGSARRVTKSPLEVSGSAVMRYQMTLGAEDEIRLVWPMAKSFAGPGVPADLFDTTRFYTAKDGGLLWILGRSLAPPGRGLASQRLSDAVAVAGLCALDGNHRRAVLLVLSGRAADASRTDPALVQHYLETIRVPFYVWSVAEPAAAPGLAAWGKVEDVSTFSKMRKAFERIKDDLDSQVLIWVDGRHLPQSITLEPAAAEAVELLGTP